uniref:Portal protein n=1 Tax=Pseudomonas phage HRDY3 TaxID=3236930 RepID=A0AB39CDW3_9VIRU
MKLRKTNRTQISSAPQQPSRPQHMGMSKQHYPKTDQQKIDEYLATAASGGNAQLSQMPIEIDIDPLLKDIVFSEDLEQKKLVMRIYTDMYYNDSIGGSIVDIKSQLMFSDFTISGIMDRKVMDDFMENIDRLDIRNLMPDVAIDYNVKGGFIASLLYNEKTQVFSRVMPHAYENTKLDQLPFHGTDPLITVAFPEYIRSTMQSDSPRVKALREFLGADVMKQLSNEALELDQKSTVYVPRRSGSSSTGTSYFRRIMPWYLLEKNLFRGTLVRSAMRQKGILHVTLDGAGEWEPTLADMQAVMDMFMNADADPVGAVVATRGGISTEEIRDPQGGWTIFDNKDAIDSIKMKALGISDAFLSGDATYANGDTSTSFFIDAIRTERDWLTRKTLYSRIFPMISALKGYVLNRDGKLSTRGNSLDKLDPLGSFERLNDGTKLLIPSVHWEKTLQPEGDQQYMDMLQAMSDKGVPVPLRVMAAAGGLNLDRLLAGQDSDLQAQEQLYQYQKKIKELKKKYGIDDMMGGDGGGGGMGGFASAVPFMGTAAAYDAQMDYMARNHPGRFQAFVAEAHSLYNQNLDYTHSDVLARNNGKIVGLANRDFGEMGEAYGYTHDGKKRILTNQKQAHERQNRKIEKMLREADSQGRRRKTRL